MRILTFLLAFCGLSLLAADRVAAKECPEYDLLQLGFFAELGAGFAGLPGEFCKSCGGQGQLACGEDGDRTCDAGLHVYSAHRGITDKVETRLVDAGQERDGKIVEVFGTIAARMQFCLPLVPFRQTTPPPPAQVPDSAQRTYVLIPGMGGNIPPDAFTRTVRGNPGGESVVKRLVREKYHRVYAVDYNAGNARQGGTPMPMRIYEVSETGALTEVYRGTRPRNGLALDFFSIAAEIAGALPDLEIEGGLSLVGYSMGGYLVKSVVYQHYERLAQQGLPIREVIFAAHPHFAEAGVSGPELATMFCTELTDGTFLEGFEVRGPGDVPNVDNEEQNAVAQLLKARNQLRSAIAEPLGNMMAFAAQGSVGIFGEAPDPQLLISQTCQVGLWLSGWSNAMATTRRPVRSIDRSDFPAITWTALAGAKSEIDPGDENFYSATVTVDGRTPVSSALGIDAFGKFPGPERLSFDRRVTEAACGHDYECLMTAIYDTIPQGPPRPGIPYLVRGEDSLWSVASAAMQTPEDLDAYWRLMADANGLSLRGERSGLAPGQMLDMPRIGRRIQPGDTLWGMVDPSGDWPRFFRAGAASLTDDPDLIYPGRMLP